MQLHLLNGDSAAEALAASERCDPGEIIVSPDILSCGPLRDHARFENWSDERLQFWQNVLSGRDLPRFEPPARYLNTATERICSASELILWAGNALSDQLFLAAMFRILEWIGAESVAVRIVQLENHHQTLQPVVGLASLTPDQIAMLPGPDPVQEDQRRALRSFWSVATGNEPERLLEWIETLATQPILQRASRLLLKRFPARSSGLGYWDEILLRHCSTDWMDLDNLIGTVLRSEAGSLDPVGDLYLEWRLRRLASSRLERPLLELDRIDAAPSGGRLHLTAAGAKVQEGKINAIDLNGIDDWIGGIHLDSSLGQVWLRDGQKLFNTFVSAAPE